MANQQLIDYIKQQLQAGYDINTLKSYIIKYGYPPKDVEEAINALYHPEVKHVVHHLSKNTIIAVSLTVLLLLIPSMYFLFLQDDSGPSRLLDLKTSTVNSDIGPGDKLEFIIELSNLGKNKRYDVFLKHEIIGTEISQEETIAVETSTSKKSSVNIPLDIAPRRYTLKTTATYGDQKAFSTTGFNIKGESLSIPKNITCTERWQCNNWIPSVCPSNGEQTRTCSDSNNCGTIIHKPETEKSCIFSIIEKPNLTKELLSKNTLLVEERNLENIKELSRTDFSRAIWECGTFNQTSLKDLCYLSISSEAGNTESCAYIENEMQKDECYMSYAINNNDFSICDNVINANLKDSCEKLRG